MGHEDKKRPCLGKKSDQKVVFIGDERSCEL